MFNLHVFYTAKDKATLDRFYDEVRAAGIIEATHEEEGNIRYEYYFCAARDNEILIVEQWKDRASQEYHDSLPHLVTLGEIKQKTAYEMVIEEVR